MVAAYAESGQFSEAVQTAPKAVDLAQQQDKLALAKAIQTKIRLYETKTPYRTIQ